MVKQNNETVDNSERMLDSKKVLLNLNLEKIYMLWFQNNPVGIKNNYGMILEICKFTVLQTITLSKNYDHIYIYVYIPTWPCRMGLSRIFSAGITNWLKYILPASTVVPPSFRFKYHRTPGSVCYYHTIHSMVNLTTITTTLKFLQLHYSGGWNSNCKKWNKKKLC